MENLTENSAEVLTFEMLPKAFTYLISEVSEVKRLLIAMGSEQTTEASDRWFNISELSSYHPDRPKRATIYYWVYQGIVPVHKDGKKLRFLKSEIDTWLLRGSKKVSNKVYRKTGLEAERGNNE
jgi:hypothetical protein